MCDMYNLLMVKGRAQNQLIFAYSFYPLNLLFLSLKRSPSEVSFEGISKPNICAYKVFMPDLSYSSCDSLIPEKAVDECETRNQLESAYDLSLCFKNCTYLYLCFRKGFIKLITES